VMQPSDHDLAKVEAEVLGTLLRGDDPTLVVLREQYENAEVISRERTGVGFYTKWSVPANLPRLPRRPNFKLGQVSGSAANVRHGVGFVLFIKDGAIHMLEGYTFDEQWPERLEGLKLAGDGGINDPSADIYST
jgi:hypothetical protein